MNRTINKSIKKFQTLLSFSQQLTKQSITRITKRAKVRAYSWKTSIKLLLHGLARFEALNNHKKKTERRRDSGSYLFLIQSKMVSLMIEL